MALDLEAELAADPWELLRWQLEMGADEAISETPLDRFALSAAEARARSAAAAAPTPASRSASRPAARAEAPVATAIDPAAEAAALAAEARDLPGLAALMQGFEGCELKRGARNLVFSDGNPAARVMVIGEAPGREEDLEGRPFVGPIGELLDAMFAAIGLSRHSPDPERALYLTDTLPWRPFQAQTAGSADIEMLTPFLRRHVELASPDFLVLMGNIPCTAVLGRGGIARLRGQWTESWGLPVLPMLHPSYLLRNSPAKREAWADLLSLRARLGG